MYKLALNLRFIQVSWLKMQMRRKIQIKIKMYSSSINSALQSAVQVTSIKSMDQTSSQIRPKPMCRLRWCLQAPQSISQATKSRGWALQGLWTLRKMRVQLAQMQLWATKTMTLKRASSLAALAPSFKETPRFVRLLLTNSIRSGRKMHLTHHLRRNQQTCLKSKLKDQALRTSMDATNRQSSS